MAAQQSDGDKEFSPSKSTPTSLLDRLPLIQSNLRSLVESWLPPRRGPSPPPPPPDPTFFTRSRNAPRAGLGYTGVLITTTNPDKQHTQKVIERKLGINITRPRAHLVAQTAIKRKRDESDIKGDKTEGLEESRSKLVSKYGGKSTSVKELFPSESNRRKNKMRKVGIDGEMNGKRENHEGQEDNVREIAISPVEDTSIEDLSSRTINDQTMDKNEPEVQGAESGKDGSTTRESDWGTRSHYITNALDASISSSNAVESLPTTFAAEGKRLKEKQRKKRKKKQRKNRPGSRRKKRDRE